MIGLRSRQTARRKFLRAAASATVISGLAAWSLTRSAVVAANSKNRSGSAGLPFTVFDGTLYRNKPDLLRYGIRPANIIYGQHFWADLGKKNQLPERETVGRLAREAAGRGDLVVLDIEHWFLHRGQDEVTESLRKYLTVLQWFREAAPTLRVGYFGMLPIIDYERSSGALGVLHYKAWQMDNDRLKPLAAAVDAVFPAPYTFFPDRDGWVSYATALIRESRRYGKLVYVFLWPQYSEVNKEIGHRYLPADFWARQLETARQEADGIVIWGGWDAVRRDYADWNEEAPWWRVTRKFTQRLRSQESS